MYPVGRVLDISVEPGGLRLAAASGGFWKTIIIGIFPVLVPAGDQITSLRTGSIATHPTNSDIVFVGTGEHNQPTPGTGLWNTTDAGTTWSQIPMSPEPWAFYRIRFTPGNPNRIHAATTDGYYLSTDAGAHWTRRVSGYVNDIAINPLHPDSMYIGVFGVGIERSTNGGSDWSPITAPGLPSTNIGRVSVSLCNNAPGSLYVLMAKGFPGIDSLRGVFKTTNSGISWTTVTPSGWYRQQMDYNNTIGVCPTNPNLVLAGGVHLYRSTNGGAGWTDISSDPDIHDDQHAITWHSDGLRVWVGNDGGCAYSANAGSTWSSLVNVVPITQFYSLSSSEGSQGVILGGTQDNSVPITSNSGTTWFFPNFGGDGAGALVDANSPSTVYAANWGYDDQPSMRRWKSTDFGVSWTGFETGIPASGNWWTCLRQDKEPNNHFVYTNSGPYVYYYWGPNNQWLRLNTTAFPAEVWGLDVAKYEGTNVVVYAALHPASPVAGTKLRVYDGGTWQERSAGLPAAMYIRRVSVHPRSSTIAYAMIEGEQTRGATKDEVDRLKQENAQLREAVADLTVEARVLKKSLF